MDTVQTLVKLTFEQLVDAVKQLPRNKQKELARRIGEWQSNGATARKRNGAATQPRKSTSGTASAEARLLGQTKTVGVKQKSGSNRAETESDLIARIKLNSRLPDTAQRRFNRLRRKLQDETISEPELTELQELWRQVERMNVERLKALVELARRRGTDVEKLMSEMGLNRRRNVF